MSRIQLSEIVFQFLDFNRMNQKSLSKKIVSIFQSLIQKKSKIPSAYSSASSNIKCTVEAESDSKLRAKQKGKNSHNTVVSEPHLNKEAYLFSPAIKQNS